ncbi:hypothetical protein GH714_021919 [Hevea brasiliensis]|uniref:F-box domain-containing protein n=1 Tax=Hevea brasiliensis TaxID=3981 RepID=A0A6A6MUE9_HEVBR|nr:hypothetical protein GH714_021919 [Hevea brasiliensis]
MGGVNSSRAVASELFEVSQSKTCKRQRLSSISCEESPRLIPSLPDEISIQILARLPKICYLKMRWQRLPTMPGVSFEDESKKGLAALRMWNVVGSSIKIADTVMSWLRKKGTLDRLPFHGSAVGAIDGCLYVLGGLSKASAMRCVWRYNPILNAWSEMSPMSIGRAFSKTGILNNKLYVVGGVAKGRGGLTSLQSAEVFDPYTGMWSEIPSMPFSKAQVLPTAFLADLLKPIATGMASYRGRLFVAQSLYCWPFFVDVGGEIYDPELNAWNEMPTGMGEGWPVKQAGTKLSVTVEDELYALEPSSSLDSARIKVDVRNHLASSSSSSALPFDDSRNEEAESAAKPETCLWRVIATKNASSADLNMFDIQESGPGQLWSHLSVFTFIVNCHLGNPGVLSSHAKLGSDVN